MLNKCSHNGMLTDKMKNKILNINKIKNNKMIKKPLN